MVRLKCFSLKVGILALSPMLCSIGLSQTSGGNNNDAITHALYNAYWSVGMGFQSLAQLHNNLISEQLTVQTVLFMPDGSDIHLSAVTLHPLGNATIDIGAELAQRGLTKPLSGSASFKYERKYSGALSAEIYVENMRESLAFTIPSAENPPVSVTQIAVFWLPSPNAEVYVALQNTSNRLIHVLPSLTMGSLVIPLGQVVLPPYGSSTVGISKLSKSLLAGAWAANSVGGITVVQDGPKGALNTGGWIEEDNLGYSTTMTFADPTVAGTRLIGTQILVGHVAELLNVPGLLTVSSQLVVCNTSNHSAVFDGQLVFSDNRGTVVKAPIQQTPIAAGEVRRIDLGQIKAQAGVPAVLVSASIELRYPGNSGALMARVFGTSEDGAYGFYWALQSSSGRSYAESFWTTANQWTPILTIGNFGNAADTVTVEFTSNAGTFSVPSFRLQPYESHTFNVRDLLNEAKPFASGVDFGGYRISGASNQSQLVVKEHLLDPASKLATPFYGTYVYVSNIYFDPSSYTGYVGGNTVGVFVSAQFSDMSTATVCPYAYGSLQTGVATAAQNGCYGTVSTVSVGTATVFARATEISDSQGDYADFYAEAQVTVRPPDSVAATNTALADTCTVDYPYGFHMNITYQLYDNASPRNPYAVSGLVCWEKVSDAKLDGVAHNELNHDWLQTNGGCGTTDSSGVFHDTPFGFCYNSSVTYTATVAMSFVVSNNRYTVRTNSVSFGATGVGTGTMTNGDDASMTRN